MKRLISNVIFMMLIIGCSHAQKSLIPDDESLSTIQKAIVGVMGHPRKISENQREFFSEYFSRNLDAKFNPEKSKERAFSQFIILGARRPYEVEVHVLIERKVDNEYQTFGEDRPRAKQLAKELETKLHQSRAEGNLIDDFRAF